MTSFSDLSDGQQVWYVAKRILLGMVALIVFLGSWTVIGPGEQGIKVTLGRVSNETLSSGFHFKLPLFTSIEKVSIQTQTDNDKLAAASKDLQDVTIETVVNWHVQPNRAMDIYKQYRGLKNYTTSVVAPIIRDAVKATSAKYTAEELVQKREDFASNVSLVLTEKLNEVGGLFEGVQIVNFDYSDSFTKAIEAKVVAEQDALAAKNKLEQTKYEADQRIAQAKGEAEAIRIQAQAITQQGGADYVKLRWIDKWDGQLPTTTLGESTPLVNIQ